MILILLACSGSDADVSSLPKVENPPVAAPKAPVAAPVAVAPADSPEPPAGATTTWPLQEGTPPGVSIYTTKKLDAVVEKVDGASGVVLKALAGETLALCTDFTPITGPVTVRARTERVKACTTEGCKLPAVQLRSFGADKKPVGPPSRIGGLGATDGWATGEWKATPLPNATQARICVSIPEGDAVVAVDWIAIYP